ncbi:hypothetical protein J6590_091712 [Homalodisca vitripennis]|nr:hypothetical protein J6590_091712 [Homalodisca vitripennis]
MTLPATTRVVRGGRAVETVYWHVSQGKTGSTKLVKRLEMTLPATTRVVRGGRAVETVYWHVSQGKTGSIKLVKRLVFHKKLVPKEPNVADQAFSKLERIKP